MTLCLMHHRAWQPTTLGGPGRPKHPAGWAPFPRWKVRLALLTAEAWGCMGHIHIEVAACDVCEEPPPEAAITGTG